MSQETIQIAKSISTEFATALKSQVSQLRDEFNSNLSLTAESVTSIRRIVDEFESKWLAVDSQIGHQKTLMEAQKSIFDVEIKSLKGLIQDVLSKSVNQIVDDLKSEFGEKLRVNEGLHDEFTKKLSDNERANIDRVKTVIDSFEKKWANMDGAIADHADRFAKELTNIRKSIAESFNVDTVMNRILDEHGHLLKGAKGDEGEPGKSPSPTEVAKHILRDKTFAEMVKPEPVDPVVVADTLIKRHGDELKGKPGKDADPVDVVEVVGELMLKHGEAIRGKPGRDADERLVAEKLVSDQKFIGLVKEVIHSEPWSVGVYREGSVVKHFTGREYIAMQDTTEEPGDSNHWKRIGTHGLRDTGGFKDKHDYEPGDFYHKDGSTFFFDGVNHRLFAAKPFTKAEFDKEFKKIQDTVLKYHELHTDSQKSIGLIEDVLVQNKAVIEDQGQRIQSLEKDVVDLLLQPTEINDGSVPLRAYKGQYIEGNDYTRGDVVTSYGVAYVKQSDGNGGLGDKSTWAKMTGGVSRSGGSSNGSLVQQYESTTDLPSALQFGAGVAQVRNEIITSDGATWQKGNAKSPRIVENIILGSERFEAGTNTGTGTGTITNLTVPTITGIKNNVLKCDSGSSGRAYANVNSTPITSGNWYCVSCDVVDFTLSGSAACIQAYFSSGAAQDRGTISITADKIIAGGVGRYAFAFRCSVSGNLDMRFGVGLNAAVANQSMTVTKWMVESLGSDPKDGFGPSEYVYPKYEAAFNCLKNSAFDSNNKVITPSVISYFPTKKYSNILVFGDSRNDEISNIGGQLLTLMKADNSGGCSWFGYGGLKALDVINGFTHSAHTDVPLNLDRLANLSALTRDFSTNGDEEMYDYLYPNVMRFDTFAMVDFGYNSVQFKSLEGKTPAVSAQETIDEITIIIDAFAAKGYDIIMTDNNPCGAFASLHVNTVAALKLLNAKIEQLCKSRGYLFVSIYQALSDATTEDNLAAAYSADDLHLNSTGSTLVAQMIKDAMDRYR